MAMLIVSLGLTPETIIRLKRALRAPAQLGFHESWRINGRVKTHDAADSA